MIERKRKRELERQIEKGEERDRKGEERRGKERE